MASGGISGKDGDFKIGSTQVEVDKWSFQAKSNNPVWSSNKTSGVKTRTAGVRDSSGSISGIWDPTSPATSLLADGATGTFKFYVTANSYIQVAGIISDFKLDWEHDSNKPVMWSASWEQTAAWSVTSSEVFGGDGGGGGMPITLPPGEIPSSLPAAVAAELKATLVDAARDAILPEAVRLASEAAAAAIKDFLDQREPRHTSQSDQSFRNAA